MRIEGIEILSEADMGPALRLKFSRIAREMDLSQKAMEKYEETINEDVELVKKGRKPSMVVGARAYIICLLIGEPRGQRQIAWTIGCSEASIRNIYQIMTGRGKARVHRANNNI